MCWKPGGVPGVICLHSFAGQQPTMPQYGVIPGGGPGGGPRGKPSIAAARCAQARAWVGVAGARPRLSYDLCRVPRQAQKIKRECRVRSRHAQEAQ
jgi:hypothetical protein